MKKLKELLGNIGFIIYLLLSLTISALPVFTIGFSWWVSLILLFLMTIIPFVSVPLWIWACICVFNGTHHLNTLGLVLFWIVFVLFVLKIALDFIDIFGDILRSIFWTRKAIAVTVSIAAVCVVTIITLVFSFVGSEKTVSGKLFLTNRYDEVYTSVARFQATATKDNLFPWTNYQIEQLETYNGIIEFDEPVEVNISDTDQKYKFDISNDYSGFYIQRYFYFRIYRETDVSKSVYAINDSNRGYCTSISSNVFHRSSCYYVDQISYQNKRYIDTAAECYLYGKRPCEHCLKKFYEGYADYDDLIEIVYS